MKTWIPCILAVTTLLFAQDRQKEQPALPKIGEAAPTFTLNDHDGKSVTIGGESDQWTVLAFYPKAATPG